MAGEVMTRIERLGNPVAGSRRVTSKPGEEASVKFEKIVGGNSAHCFSGLLVSYSKEPSGGGLEICDSLEKEPILDIDICSAGEKFIPLDGIRSQIGSEVVITLRGGKGTTIAKLNVLGHRFETR